MLANGAERSHAESVVRFDMRGPALATPHRTVQKLMPHGTLFEGLGSTETVARC